MYMYMYVDRYNPIQVAEVSVQEFYCHRALVLCELCGQTFPSPE